MDDEGRDVVVVEEMAIVPKAQPEMDVKDVVEQVHKVQALMEAVMVKDLHYGVIPGIDKPSLFQPGAQKLGLTFRLVPQYEIKETYLDNGHYRVRTTCRLVHQPTGADSGEGVGFCSSEESKYAFRTANLTCPACGQAHIIKGKEEYGGGWLCWKKKGGCGATFKDGDPVIEKQERGQIPNPNIADTFNTILKMSKKRAYVDAMITACAASDLFTQDVEDMPTEAVLTKATPPPPGDNSGPVEKKFNNIMQMLEDVKIFDGSYITAIREQADEARKGKDFKALLDIHLDMQNEVKKYNNQAATAAKHNEEPPLPESEINPDDIPL